MNEVSKALFSKIWLRKEEPCVPYAVRVSYERCILHRVLYTETGWLDRAGLVGTLWSYFRIETVCTMFHEARLADGMSPLHHFVFEDHPT